MQGPRDSLPPEAAALLCMWRQLQAAPLNPQPSCLCLLPVETHCPGPASDWALLLLQLQDPGEGQSHWALEVGAAVPFTRDPRCGPALLVPSFWGPPGPWRQTRVWKPGAGPAGSCRSRCLCPHMPTHANNKSQHTSQALSVSSPQREGNGSESLSHRVSGPRADPQDHRSLVTAGP